MKKSIVLLPGDGIGPEVTAAAASVLKNAHANSIMSFSLPNTRSAAPR